MAANYGKKKSLSALGKGRKNQIMEFNSHPYTLSLQCRSYSNFSQLLYELVYSHEL